MRVDAAVGYAAAQSGHGIAYARLSSLGNEHLLRVPFRLNRTFAPRQVGFAALTAVAVTLRKRGIHNVGFALEDQQLLDDLATHRDLDESLVLPYVRLRCALNALDEVAMRHAPEAVDLTARASAEAAFSPAA